MTARRGPDRIRAASVNGQTVVLVFPDEETVNSQSVQVVRDVTAVADDTAA